MDKVLAFSILSASPADIAAGAGIGGRWPRLSWRRSAEHDQAGEPAQQQRGKEEHGAGSHGNRARASEGSSSSFPRFAPEFDGIDCFETIVSH